MSDPNEYIAEAVHGLIMSVQENAVLEADRAHEEDRRRRIELRMARGETGVSASELLRQLADDDPERQSQRLTDEMDRVEKEAAAAAAAKEKTNEQLPADRFPAPVLTTGE